MNQITMRREDLLKIVRENKEKHIADYLEAVEGYKAAVLKACATNLKLAKTGDIAKFKFATLPQPPVSFADSYNRSIRMLELANQTEIEVEDHVFNQLVLDEWGWKNQFVGLATSYKV